MIYCDIMPDCWDDDSYHTGSYGSRGKSYDYGSSGTTYHNNQYRHEKPVKHIRRSCTISTVCFNSKQLRSSRVFAYDVLLDTVKYRGCDILYDHIGFISWKLVIEAQFETVDSFDNFKSKMVKLGVKFSSAIV